MSRRDKDNLNRVFVVAAESSGDQLGAYLIDALREQSVEPLDIRGVGGGKMAAIGVSSPVDIRPLAVMGIVDGLLAYHKVKELVQQTVQEIVRAKPQIVILIDSWGFTIRVAKQIRKHLPECKLVKYVAPQVFATRPGRAKTTAMVYDHLLTIHSFDHSFFEEQGLDTTFVGNPALFSDNKHAHTKTEFPFNPDNKTVLSVFFGSRSAEIRQLHKHFLDALDLVREEFPDLLVVSPLSDSVATEVRALAMTDSRLQDIILLEEHQKRDVFKASRLALACSGTITLELANAKVPSVVGYRLGGILGYPLQKLLFKAPFASLINLAAEEAVLPEYLTRECTGENLAKSLLELLQDDELYQRTQEKLKRTIDKMRGGVTSPSAAAAEKILSLLA